jgi:hypothetical protein
MLHIVCRVLISLRHVWLLGCRHFIVLDIIRNVFCIHRVLKNIFLNNLSLPTYPIDFFFFFGQGTRNIFSQSSQYNANPQGLIEWSAIRIHVVNPSYSSMLQRTQDSDKWTKQKKFLFTNVFVNANQNGVLGSSKNKHDHKW